MKTTTLDLETIENQSSLISSIIVGLAMMFCLGVIVFNVYRFALLHVENQQKQYNTPTQINKILPDQQLCGDR